MDSLNWNRNNLDCSLSLYLRQHADQPVWWQEWSNAMLVHARNSGKPLFVSVGYATCHWCHVMGAEAFSDPDVADLLNRHFICVKVDRELRPDIDQFLMVFLQTLSGQGGWPLNAFLSPELYPVYALTYAPLQAKPGQFAFAEIVNRVLNFYQERRQDLRPFVLPPSEMHSAEENQLFADWERAYDPVAGGFGTGHKFPPHATLLSMLYRMDAGSLPANLHGVIQSTLDAIRLRGLHDHLQGGLFRYCVDRFWTIPHFEKMLYDQLQGLWVFALAHKVFRNPLYRDAALGMARCLQESFARGDLFVSAHDADTEHEEGATYVWSYAELTDLLGEGDLARFSLAYDVSENGNFEGRNHLVRHSDLDVSDLEARLLTERKRRPQPAVDSKLLSGQNALAAAVWMLARRFLPKDVDDQGERTLRAVLAHFWTDSTVARASVNGVLQPQVFLFDAAATLFAVTVAYEEDAFWEHWLEPLKKAVLAFRIPEGWLESRNDDFPAQPANRQDQPLPSGTALAELALVRLALLQGSDVPQMLCGPAHHSDFSHLAALLASNEFHWVKGPVLRPWNELPASVIQIRSAAFSDCHQGVCRFPDGR